MNVWCHKYHQFVIRFISIIFVTLKYKRLEIFIHKIVSSNNHTLCDYGNGLKITFAKTYDIIAVKLSDLKFINTMIHEYS